MQDRKTVEIIEAVKNMTDRETAILEVFISGLRAGKQAAGLESGNRQIIPPGTQVIGTLPSS